MHVAIYTYNIEIKFKNNTFTYDRGHTLIFAILFFPFRFFHSTKN